MDVSRWQGSIDWGKVKASGLVSGVMLRALGNSAEDKPSKLCLLRNVARTPD